MIPTWGLTEEQIEYWQRALAASQRPSNSVVMRPQPGKYVPPHDRLDVDGWVKLCRELDYWNPEVTVEEFWERVSRWNAAYESQSGTSEAPSQPEEASSQTEPEQGMPFLVAPPGAPETG